MLFQPEEDILLIAGSGAVPHVPAAVFKSGGIISRRHIPVPGNGTEVDLQFVCSTGFGESHGFEFLNFVIHVPVILHSLRESLLSYGSYHSTIRIQVAPMSKQFWLSLSHSAEPFFCSTSSAPKILILTHCPFYNSSFDALQRPFHCRRVKFTEIIHSTAN